MIQQQHAISADTAQQWQPYSRSRNYDHNRSEHTRQGWHAASANIGCRRNNNEYPHYNRHQGSFMEENDLSGDSSYKLPITRKPVPSNSSEGPQFVHSRYQNSLAPAQRHDAYGPIQLKEGSTIPEASCLSNKKIWVPIVCLLAVAGAVIGVCAGTGKCWR